MNQLKRNVIWVLLQLIVPCTIAQNDDLLFKQTGLNIFSKYTVSIEMDKTVFSIDELIYVKFKIDFTADSVKNPYFDNFKIIRTTESSSVSYKNGAKVVTKTMLYVLKPDNIGEYIIKSPLFFVNGERVQGSKKITVLNIKLTKQEQSEVRIQAFAEQLLQPKGTYRYILSDEFGYIEVSTGHTWEFYRSLTKKEFNLIKKIK